MIPYHPYMHTIEQLAISESLNYYPCTFTQSTPVLLHKVCVMGIHSMYLFKVSTPRMNIYTDLSLSVLY